MNRDTLLAAVGGRWPVLRAMARLCVEEDAPRLLAQLHRAAEAGDLASVEAAAHGLKGLAAEFRAERAVQAAHAIETAARENTVLHEAIDTFTREYAELDAALHSLLAPEAHA